jgi:hypothetical protein
MNPTIVKATVHNGRVEVSVPTDWPEGAEVAIEQVESLGMREEDWPTTPEEIANPLRRWDEIGALETTGLGGAGRGSVEAKSEGVHDCQHDATDISRRRESVHFGVQTPSSP